NKGQNDEELDLGKSHKDIPSTCEQGMEVVQRGKAPIIERAKAKGNEYLVENPGNQHISDLLLPSLPLHGANHHNPFDTNVGKIRSTLSSKGYLHLFRQPPSYAWIKTKVTLHTRTEIGVIR
ncbi:hypothetical protein KI387_038223, partial [Taxus chinensis]